MTSSECAEPLEELRQDLAPHVVLTGLAVGDDAPRGREDVDPLAAQHRVELGHREVNPAAGLADALDVPDDVLAVEAVALEGLPSVTLYSLM